MTPRERRAYQIGSRDALAGRPLRDMWSESAALMDEMGETTPTTGRNAPRRLRLVEAYEDGWHTARSASRL